MRKRAVIRYAPFGRGSPPPAGLQNKARAPEGKQGGRGESERDCPTRGERLDNAMTAKKCGGSIATVVFGPPPFSLSLSAARSRLDRSRKKDQRKTAVGPGEYYSPRLTIRGHCYPVLWRSPPSPVGFMTVLLPRGRQGNFRPYFEGHLI